jgi:sugar phosphate isomerase/epimerase
MKFGVCSGKLSRLFAIMDAGYDYIEMNFANLALMTEEEFAQTRDALVAAGFCAETFNGFFKSNVVLYGESVDLDAIASYCETGFSRAAALGGKVAVLGSGGARSVPEGMTREQAEEQFCRVLTVCGDVALKHGMRIAIEPLRACECNYINLVSEGAALCRRVNHPAVKLLVDFFHFWCGDEPLSHLYEAADVLIHAHLARPNLDRKMPMPEDRETVASWAKALRDIGYTGRLSLEGSHGDDFDESIRRTREYLNLFS